MLILQRKKGQSLTIGDDITLTISEIGPDWVRLAIDAPKDVLVLRSELVEAAEENKAAAQTASLQLLNQLFNEK
ncbi:carbon storage regulator [Mediterraneibacter agrestimuris]|uniref:carbon storage regulator n=1 Tax=Mediterraneibacter agrestimuris TaxID=2941333 RepID=UPI002041EABE|nr:carbon storage regulator [Mediterraneibacter agrestimuris]